MKKEKKIMTFCVRDKVVSIQVDQYIGGRLCLQALTENGDVYSKISTNLPQYPCGRFQFYAKEWDGGWNTRALQVMMDNGVVREVDKDYTAPTGFIADVRLFEVVQSKSCH
jgi:hypothetical protein